MLCRLLFSVALILCSTKSILPSLQEALSVLSIYMYLYAFRIK